VCFPLVFCTVGKLLLMILSLVDSLRCIALPTFSVHLGDPSLIPLVIRIAATELDVVCRTVGIYSLLVETPSDAVFSIVQLYLLNLLPVGNELPDCCLCVHAPEPLVPFAWCQCHSHGVILPLSPSVALWCNVLHSFSSSGHGHLTGDLSRSQCVRREIF
jgi:hypothetical protein